MAKHRLTDTLCKGAGERSWSFPTLCQLRQYGTNLRKPCQLGDTQSVGVYDMLTLMRYWELVTRADEGHLAVTSLKNPATGCCRWCILARHASGYKQQSTQLALYMHGMLTHKKAVCHQHASHRGKAVPGSSRPVSRHDSKAVQQVD